MEHEHQQILILGFFLPADNPSAQKTPPVFKHYARSDQSVTVDRLDNFFVAWDGQSLHVAKPDDRTSLLDFDVVHIVDWSINEELSYAVSSYLRQHGILNTNDSIMHAVPGTKLGEMVQLTSADVRYPRSFYTGKGHKLVDLFNWASQTFDVQFPVVVKGTDAAQGADNFLAASIQELADLPVNPKGRYIMQEFIPNIFDYRVLILGGNVSTIIKRTRIDDSSHLNNTSLGARAEIVSPDDLPKVAALAMRAATALHRLEHAGVDVIVNADTGELYILEVNRRPDISSGQPEIIEHKLAALYDYIASLK